MFAFFQKEAMLQLVDSIESVRRKDVKEKLSKDVAKNAYLEGREKKKQEKKKRRKVLRKHLVSELIEKEKEEIEKNWWEN
jgi:hypothetical protein